MWSSLFGPPSRNAKANLRIWVDRSLLTGLDSASSLQRELVIDDDGLVQCTTQRRHHHIIHYDDNQTQHSQSDCLLAKYTNIKLFNYFNRIKFPEKLTGDVITHYFLSCLQFTKGWQRTLTINWLPNSYQLFPLDVMFRYLKKMITRYCNYSATTEETTQELFGESNNVMTSEWLSSAFWVPFSAPTMLVWWKMEYRLVKNLLKLLPKVLYWGILPNPITANEREVH